MAGRVTREWLVRSVSGALYIALVVVGVFLGPGVALALFGVLGLLSLHEYYGLVGSFRSRPTLYPLEGYLCGALLFAGVGLRVFGIGSLWGEVVVYLGLGLLVLLLPFRVIHVKEREGAWLGWSLTALGVLYIIVPFCLALRLGMMLGEYEARLILFPFILIWVCDTGAFVVGNLLGRHRLLESVSPGKSWEGYVGGVLLSGVAGWGLYYFSPGDWGALFWIFLGLVVGAVSPLGDLAESQLKRAVGVKDSGRFLAGHGGFLDRFDSALVAFPVVYVYFRVFFLLAG